MTRSVALHIRPVNVLALVLPLIAGAVWAPQLLKKPHSPRFTTDDEQPAEDDFPTDASSASEGDPSEMADSSWDDEQAQPSDAARDPVPDFDGEPGTAPTRIVLRPGPGADTAPPAPPLGAVAEETLASADDDEQSLGGASEDEALDAMPSNPLLASLESTLGELKAMNSRRKDLGELLNSGWGQPASTEDAVEPLQPEQALVSAPNYVAALAEWVGERRLTGVVYGPGLALAMFDDQIVTPETRFQGGVRVAGVGPNWLDVELRGHVQRIQLESFRPTQPASFDGDDDEADADAAGASNGGGGESSRAPNGLDLLQSPGSAGADAELTRALEAIANPSSAAQSGKADQ